MAVKRRKPIARYPLDPRILRMIDVLQTEGAYTYPGELISALVRQEWERRHGQMQWSEKGIADTAFLHKSKLDSTLNETAAPAAPAAPEVQRAMAAIRATAYKPQ